ncbi:E3 ubiquitin-protein ligase SINA-like 7 isoform X1 [Primulina huaijiensis]|uniref:E3 ubiquitin-protein ligase SINA-like 7 isoform X1 n=1 Tax=Primulina huaijiensis TaxID=1492673 RepID=UPI003CC75765
MARFSAFGDEDGREHRRHASKRPRTSSDESGQSATISPERFFSSRRRFSSSRRRRMIEIREESEMESDAALSDSDRLSPLEEPDEYAVEGDEEDDDDDDEEEEEEEELQDQPSRDAPAPITVTLTDPDVLDCPICLDPLSPPVYQCENGHISCASCCTKMKNKCGTCSWPIGYNRCRAIEMVLESVKIACKNTQHGCGETINYSKKHDHEKTCIYTPCACPHQLCTHVSIFNSLYTHFATAHSHACKKFFFNTVFSVVVETSQKYLFLQERLEDILFVLDHTIDSLGSFISVVCVAPTSSNRSFTYDISAKDGTSSIRVKTVAENMPKWVSQPRAKKLFLMPKDFIDSIKIELLIQSVAK